MTTEDIILICLFSLAIILLMVDIYNVKTKGMDCLKNPLSYGIKEWNEANDDELLCVCTFKENNQDILWVSENNLTIIKGMN